MKRKFRVEAPDAEKTAESFLSQSMGLRPRTALKSAFKGGKVWLNGRAIDRQALVREGDVIEVDSERLFATAELTVSNDTAPAFELQILAESQHFVAAYKPAGVNAHPLRPDESGTLLNALANRYPETGAAMRPERPLEGGLVHRLDRGTSGVLLCARSEEAFKRIKESWRSDEIEKVYLAWVSGRFESSRGVACVLSRDLKAAKRMRIVDSVAEKKKSWTAVSLFYPVKQILLNSGDWVSLVAVQIKTGVTHQIRVSLAGLGHPVLGDPVYGRMKPNPLMQRAAVSLSKRQNQFLKGLTEIERGLPNPQPGKLPEHAFFLHAYWLRLNCEPELARGIRAKAPEFWF